MNEQKTSCLWDAEFSEEEGYLTEQRPLLLQHPGPPAPSPETRASSGHVLRSLFLLTGVGSLPLIVAWVQTT